MIYTPFTTLQTDGITPYFWDIATRGDAEHSISSDPKKEKKVKVSYQSVHRGGRNYSIFVYCSETELYHFEKYLNSLGNQYFKIIGTSFLDKDTLKHFIDLSLWNDLWRYEIENLNFKQ